MDQYDRKGKSAFKEMTESTTSKKESARDLKIKSSSGSKRNKIELVHLEDVQDEKPKRSRWHIIRRHFVRYWLCYGIAAFIFLAIFLPLLFLKIVPALAQLIVDKTDLPISHGSLKAVSNDEVIIGLQSQLTVPSGITVKLDPIDLYLYNEDTKGFYPYTVVPLGKHDLSGKTDITVENQTVHVGNRTELNTWLSRTLYQKTTEISVKGNTMAHLGALHFNIELDKSVTINALDTLRGFAVDEATLILPEEEDGTNLRGTLTLPNWSDLTIYLGNLTFNAWAGQVLIGSVSVWDVLLPPGNSTRYFQGEIFTMALFENLSDILASQSSALGEGVLEIGLSGNKTMIDGEHIEYLERVLNNAYITSQVPILQLLSDVLDSISDGDLQLSSLLDIAADGIGPLLDDLLGGDDDSGDSVEASASLDDLIDEMAGHWNRSYSARSLDVRTVSGALDELGARSEEAKKGVLKALLKGAMSK